MKRIFLRVLETYAKITILFKILLSRHGCLIFCSADKMKIIQN